MTRFHFERPDGTPDANVQNISRHLNPFVPPQGFPVRDDVPKLVAQSPVPIGGSQTAIKFNSDDTFPGTKMYIVSNTGDRIDQYSVSPAFDLTIDATFDNKTFFIPNSPPPPDELVPTGMAWSDTGTELFIVGDQNATVLQYEVGTAFDISTVITPKRTLTMPTGLSTPTGLTFNDDGSKMFVSAGTPDGKVTQFKLNTNYSLQGGFVNEGFVSLLLVVPNPRGVEFNDDGSKMFVVGRDNDKVTQFSLANPFDVTAGGVILTDEFDLSTFSINNPFGLTFSNDGLQMFVLDFGLKTVFQFTLPSPFQL